MKIRYIGLLLFLLILLIAGSLFAMAPILNRTSEEMSDSSEKIKLPSPQKTSRISVEEALDERRSVRAYSDAPLTLKEVSQLLWAAQGITSTGKRTAPSAGALYPMEIYIVVGKVKGLDPGVYHYHPVEHSLTRISEGDKRSALSAAGLRQSAIRTAAVDFVICAEYARTTGKYRERGKRYVHMEAGHIGQNVYLQAETLGLKTVVIGAFQDDAVKKVLNVNEEPLYIIPVGKPPGAEG